MSYTIERTNQFKRSFKKCVKRGFNVSSFIEVVNILPETGSLPEKYRPHKLVGKYKGLWECHIELDWLLVWDQNDTELTLLMTDTGSQADLFG